MAFPIPHDLIILLHCWASVAACTIEFTVMVDFPDPCRFFFFLILLYLYGLTIEFLISGQMLGYQAVTDTTRSIWKQASLGHVYPALMSVI